VVRIRAKARSTRGDTANLLQEGTCSRSKVHA
jgi:hypothetical protein